MRSDDFPGKAEAFHEEDGVVGEVDFVPLHAVGGGALLMVVIVVPALAEGDESDPPVVLGAVGGVEIAIAPGVGGGVHEPGGVVDEYDAEDAGPEEPRGGFMPATDEVADEAESGENRELGRPPEVFDPADDGVAHEVFGEVARGMVGARGVNDPEDVGPGEAVVGGVRIAGLIGLGMVEAVRADPGGGSALPGEYPQERESILDGSVGLEAGMGEEAVIAEGDAPGAAGPAGGEEGDEGPEREVEESGDAEDVENNEEDDEEPLDADFLAIAHLFAK